MARENRSRFAILGILTYGPMSGYDIRKVYEASVVHFWSESYGQIYPLLRQLTAEGLVSRRPERGAGRRVRNVHTLTAKGREELRRWLAEPVSDEKLRLEVLLKLFFGSEAPPAVSRAHLEAYRAHHRRLLAVYEGIRTALERPGAPSPARVYQRITLDCGIRISQAYVQWCDASLQTLEGLTAGPHTEDKTEENDHD